jgi:hypothetical protein
MPLSFSPAGVDAQPLVPVIPPLIILCALLVSSPVSNLVLPSGLLDNSLAFCRLQPIFHNIRFTEQGIRSLHRSACDFLRERHA